MRTLARQGDDFRRLVVPKKGDVVYSIAFLLSSFDVNTAMPLLLHLLDAGIDESAWRMIARDLESYVLRRAVCGLSTKNYNRVFLTLTRTLRRDGANAEAVAAYLRNLKGESTEWPSDDEFRLAWLTRNVYQNLQQPRVVYVLRRLSDALLDAKAESITVDGALSIEHLIPQGWVATWALKDGTSGMTWKELVDSTVEDPRADATRRRNALLHTIGNLTIVSKPLNSALSNGPWEKKRPELLKHSLLPINQDLHAAVEWGEEEVVQRGLRLFEMACQLWPGPGAGETLRGARV